MKIRTIKLFFSFFLITNITTAQRQFTPQDISKAALELTKTNVTYDGSYYSISYPNGDVPKNIGVCTDVIIRTFRAVGLDLQKEIHEDMSDNFDSYPKNWGLKKPDSNIDHRRVPNLMRYFDRKGKSLPITKNGSDYYPADIVAWDLGEGVTHIGMVVSILSKDKKRYQIVHNIGAGQVLEDCLFDYNIIGHYRF